MIPAVFNLPLFDSSDLSHNFTIQTTKPVLAPANFMGCTGKAEIRLSPSDAMPLLTLTVTFPDAAGGIVNVTLARAAIKAVLDAANVGVKIPVTSILAHWDLNIIDAAGKSTLWMYGACNIFRSNTRVP